MQKRFTLGWLLLGLGSQLQVVASLSITEIIVLFIAPCVFVREVPLLKRNGVLTFFLLALAVFAGCVVASVANATPFEFVIRGCAVTMLILCSIVVAHVMIRLDPNGFKWYLLGAAASSIICTFVFQKAVETAAIGGDASVEDIMSGPVYWIGRLWVVAQWPTKALYLHTPMMFDVIVGIGLALFSILTTASGRSGALILFAYVVMLILGGKSMRSMRRVSRHFGMVVILGVCGIFLAHFAYRISATSGVLGEEARNKYERQTQGDKSIGRLVLGGRAAAFVGLLACRDKPIIGWGPWAMDENGYTHEFMLKYGTDADVRDLYRSERIAVESGLRRMIPCHAYITEFWCWYGIAGLIFWLYVLFVLFRYLRQDCWAVPQWYAWIACSIPSVCWGIFFSPFADRFGIPLFVVACLMARAVRNGTFQLPMDMMVEIEKSNRR